MVDELVMFFYQKVDTFYYHNYSTCFKPQQDKAMVIHAQRGWVPRNATMHITHKKPWQARWMLICLLLPKTDLTLFFIITWL